MPSYKCPDRFGYQANFTERARSMRNRREITILMNMPPPTTLRMLAALARMHAASSDHLPMPDPGF